MQLFNEINSRKIYNELNAFEGIFRNGIFAAVVLISAIFQFITVQFAGLAFKTVKPYTLNPKDVNTLDPRP